VPSGTSGAATVVVENTDLQSAALASAYTYLNPASLEWDLTAKDYGNLTINSSVIFTLTLGLGNTCDGVTLDAGESCTVEATFLGDTVPAGSYAADLEATAGTGGTSTSGLTAIRDP
jgi:hypothetical protein